MGIDLYYTPGSAPCRAVQMTAKAVGVDLNLKLTNLMAGEHMTPEFLKLNPQHTIPTLVDEGFALWESRAIQVYLVEKYGKTDSLYPKCPKKRAVVNQRLYFDLGTLYGSLAAHYYPQVSIRNESKFQYRLQKTSKYSNPFINSFSQIFAKQPANPETLKKVEDAFGFLNTFLEGQTYAAGDSLTLADISLLATVSTAVVMGFDLSKYSNVQRWLANAKATTPGNDLNEAGIEAFRQKFLS